MGKSTKRQRKQEARDTELEWESFNKGQIKFIPFEPMNDKQAILFDAAINEDMVIAYGYAGTSKSYTLCAAALKLIADHPQTYHKILVLRSPIPCGPSTGLKPGTSEEKIMEWSDPVMSNFRKAGQTENNNDGFYRYLTGTKKLEAREMAAIKGSSWDNTIVILEEAEECSLEQVKNLVTRIGENSKLFINGDFSQANNKVRDKAMIKYISALEKYNSYVLSLVEKGVEREEWQTYTPLVRFEKADCVRSGTCRLNIEIFELIETGADIEGFDGETRLIEMSVDSAADFIRQINDPYYNPQEQQYFEESNVTSLPC